MKKLLLVVLLLTSCGSYKSVLPDSWTPVYDSGYYTEYVDTITQLNYAVTFDRYGNRTIQLKK